MRVIGREEEAIVEVECVDHHVELLVGVWLLVARLVERIHQQLLKGEHLLLTLLTPADSAGAHLAVDIGRSCSFAA